MQSREELFAGALGISLALHVETIKRIFRHFVREVIYVVLNSNLCERIFAKKMTHFYVDVEYEKRLLLYYSCQIIEYSFKNYKYQTRRTPTNLVIVHMLSLLHQMLKSRRLLTPHLDPTNRGGQQSLSNNCFT